MILNLEVRNKLHELHSAMPYVKHVEYCACNELLRLSIQYEILQAIDECFIKL